MLWDIAHVEFPGFVEEEEREEEYYERP